MRGRNWSRRGREIRGERRRQLTVTFEVAGVSAPAAATRVSASSNQMAWRKAPEAAALEVANRGRSAVSGRGSWITRGGRHLQIGRRALAIGAGTSIHGPKEGNLTDDQALGGKGNGFSLPASRGRRHRGGRRAERSRVTGRMDWPWQRTRGSRKETGGKEEEAERWAPFFCQRWQGDSDLTLSGGARGRRSPRQSRGRRSWRDRLQALRPRGDSEGCVIGQDHGWAVRPKQPRSRLNRFRTVQGEQNSEPAMVDTFERNQEAGNPRRSNNEAEKVVGDLRNAKLFKR
jgi:hypothetical protein